jgi:hypothetical protein
MFRAILCSSSGGQIVCIQHTVSSLSMSGRGGRAVHTLSVIIILLETCRGLQYYMNKGNFCIKLVTDIKFLVRTIRAGRMREKRLLAILMKNHKLIIQIYFRKDRNKFFKKSTFFSKTILKLKLSEWFC